MTDDEFAKRLTALEHKIDRHYELLTAAGRAEAGLLNRLMMLERQVNHHTAEMATTLDKIASEFDQLNNTVTRLCDIDPTNKEESTDGD